MLSETTFPRQVEDTVSSSETGRHRWINVVRNEYVCGTLLAAFEYACGTLEAPSHFEQNSDLVRMEPTSAWILTVGFSDCFAHLFA